jgi:hypothetical protein
MPLEQKKPKERSGDLKWTPRAGVVLATAKMSASSRGPISAADLLLAIEATSLAHGENIASRTLKVLAVQPSTALARPAPTPCLGYRDLRIEDFDRSFSGQFPALVIDEAKAMGNNYVGIEHLLLFLARVGVTGIDLPYEQIRQTILELMGKG